MRKLSLLLALTVVLTCGLLMLASCGDTEDTSTVAPSDSVSSEAASSETASSEEPASEAASSEDASSEATASEETSSEETSSEETSTAGGDTVAEATEGVTPSGTNLALNCTYTGAEAPDASLGAYSASLTDGQASEELTYDASWFGYWYNANTDNVESRTNASGGVGTIVIDLGDVVSISAVRVNTFLGNSSGIVAPGSLKFEYSEDGTNFVVFGEKTFERAADGDGTVDWIGYTLAEAADAQYIRITVTTAGVWTFLNEIEVY